MPDIIAEVRFYPTEEGGRTRGLSIGSIHNYHYGCGFFYEDHAYECALEFPEGKTTQIELNSWNEVPIGFLSPDLIRPYLDAGSDFHLGEGSRKVAEGVVLRMCHVRGDLAGPIPIDVGVTIDDPHDFDVFQAWQKQKVRQGTVVEKRQAGNTEGVIIRLDSVFSFENTQYQHILAIPKHEGEIIAKLKTGISISSHLVLIPIDQDVESFQDTDWHRGQSGLVVSGGVWGIKQ